jgi:hypothetical protein
LDPGIEFRGDDVEMKKICMSWSDIFEEKWEPRAHNLWERDQC